MIRAVAITLILASGAFTAAAILLPFPRVSSFEGLGAFELIGWLDPLSRLGMLIVAVVTTVRFLARRNATAWLVVFLLLLVLLLVTILYAPFLLLPEPGPGADRFVEFWRHMRALTRNLVATFVLSALFLAVTRDRRTPADARQAALVVPAIVCTIFISIYVLFVVLPV